MRQIFSVRFFAAVAGVVGLFFVLTTIFATREVIDGDDGGDVATTRRIDFVAQVFSSANPAFAVSDDGLATVDTTLVIDASRSLRITRDTPGEMLCPDFPQLGACAVVADLLGEAVVWFALVPGGDEETVELPAIDTLDDGVATLVNGWQVPFAPVLDRRCPDQDFASYRELREVLGDDFVSVYGIDDRELVAVVCGERADDILTPTESGSSVADTTAPAPTVGAAGPADADVDEHTAALSFGADDSRAVDRR